MLPSYNPMALTIYIVSAWFLGICYGFVLLSSAAGENQVNLFTPGESLVYQLHSTVLLRENSEDNHSKNVGFYIAGDLSVETLWGSGTDKILKLELLSPTLHIKSRKAPSPDGFIQHSSRLEESSSHPFYLIWHNGKIEKILLVKNEAKALKNLKKGIASLFQFQLLEAEANETDASGTCTVSYQSIDPLKFNKIKSHCLSNDFSTIRTNDIILENIVRSSRITKYELDSNYKYLKSIEDKERHQMHLAVRNDIGSQIESTQILNFAKSGKCDVIKGTNLEEALMVMETELKQTYIHDTLLTELELSNDETTFVSAINELRDNLKAKQLGNAISAKAFIKLVNVARKATREDVAKALNTKKNQKILSQLLDVLGYVQTKEIHDVVMKKIHFDDEAQLDLSERYLWALALYSHPDTEVVADLLHRHQKNDNYPEKIKETLILTLATMGRRLYETTYTPQSRKLHRNIEEAIVNGLDYSKNEERYVFLRALKNLQSPTTLPILLEIIKTGTTKEAVYAFKAIKSFGPSAWNDDVLRAAQRTFFQIGKKQDSSSRTLSADILLETNPSDQILDNFLNYMMLNDTQFEVKQYLFQRLQMISDEDPEFRQKLLGLIKRNPKLNNYSNLSPRGLSIALRRNFVKSPSVNGSLLTIQEMSSGIVKRGVVNVVLGREGVTKEMIGLGIFAGGLGSFVSSDTEEEEEVANAGMELTILDNQIRPFVFFTGQGELMGHVWSGTASERTTAFQALILLQDHNEYLRLGSGFIAELDLKGAMSFDLSGKIEISLWGRSAESLVEKSAGIVSIGSITVDTSFVKSTVEFVASIEPKLSIKSDISFSSNVALCMRVTQPDTVFRYNVFKIERIPGSKHKLRIAKYKKIPVPGTTYSLNKKNNDMCSAMFSE